MNKILNKPNHKIQHMYNLSKANCLLINIKTLQDIWNFCSSDAGSNEFQVHYRSLVLECYNDNKAKIFVTIPTVFYNMPQKVTTATIDFHTDNIHENGELVKPISMQYASELEPIIAIMKTYFQHVEIMEIADNSFHRHPSRMSFSSTDYDDNLNEPGIIYRKGPCNNLLQTDSVMYFGKEPEIIVTETRIATIKKENGNIDAKYIEIPTATYTTFTKTNAIAELFGMKPKIITNKLTSDLDSLDYQDLDNLMFEALKHIPEPNIEFIDPSEITEKKQTFKNYYSEFDYDNYIKSPKKTKNKNKQTNKFTKQEIDWAYEMGYDIVNNIKDADEWMMYSDYFMQER